MEKTIENAVNFSINDILGVSLDGITYKYDFKVVCTGNVDARKDESKIRTILKELIKEFCAKNDYMSILYDKDIVIENILPTLEEKAKEQNIVIENLLVPTIKSRKINGLWV